MSINGEWVHRDSYAFIVLPYIKYGHIGHSSFLSAVSISVITSRVRTDRMILNGQ